VAEINSLDDGSLRALAEALRYVKNQLRDLQEQQARQNRDSAPIAMYVCKATSEIAAFNTSTSVPGTGTAKIYSRRGSNTTRTSGGTMTNTEQEFTVFNLSSTVANNTFIFCIRDAFGDYWVYDGAGVRIAVLDGDLAHGGSATASVYIANAGTESDSGENVTVYDFDMIGSGNEIVATTKVFIANVNGYWYVINAAACATPV
jgi:hypothetical protein